MDSFNGQGLIGIADTYAYRVRKYMDIFLFIEGLLYFMSNIYH